MPLNLNPFDAYDIRDYRPDDAASLFVLQAVLAPVDAGLMLERTQEIDDQVESGGGVWLAARGRQLIGYAALDPLPGLPGVFDLTGGVLPARRRQGIGSRLLRHAAVHAPALGAQVLSARVEGLDDEAAIFLIRRGFEMEHEECLLERGYLDDLPPVPDYPAADLVTFPRARAVREFCRLYHQSFDGHPWSQPYVEDEVDGALGREEDLLFAVVDGIPIGVVWHERLPNGRGRVEPIGIARAWQSRGHGRHLLLAALHNLRRAGAAPVEIGLWRTNTVAMHLYKGLGFTETANWYYLARDLRPEE